MSDSVNVFTLKFSGQELKKAFPHSEYDYALVKIDLVGKEFGGEKNGVITVRMELHNKKSGTITVADTTSTTVSGCPIPPCIAS